MTMNDWHKKVFEVFNEFSDIDFQVRAWFGIGPEISSATEMCNKIDDALIVDWLVANEDNLNQFLKNAILSFLEDIDSLPENIDDWKIFSSVEWMTIRLKAVVIKNLLEKHIGNSID